MKFKGNIFHRLFLMNWLSKTLKNCPEELRGMLIGLSETMSTGSPLCPLE
jgi:hypothetical protein